MQAIHKQDIYPYLMEIIVGALPVTLSIYVYHVTLQEEKQKCTFLSQLALEMTRSPSRCKYTPVSYSVLQKKFKHFYTFSSTHNMGKVFYLI